MDRTAYYALMRQRALEVRAQYGVRTEAFGLREMLAIYRDQQIQLDRWRPKLRKVRAAYFVLDDEASVLLNAAITPVEPKLFALAHELKHHLIDREAAKLRPLGCQIDFSSRDPVEIGAEIFAAEFIFPQEEFHAWLRDDLAIATHCSREDVVRVKRACPAKVSYQYIVKRLEWLGHVERGEYARTQWVKLEESIHGQPFYKRLRARRSKP
jgi:Zn-dependent peptidase ImmA (M78 family)